MLSSYIHNVVQEERKKMKARCGIAVLVLLAVLLGSCVTGQYMQLKPAENAETLGAVQSTFVITGSFRYRSVINTQAYISLLAEAQTKYPDTNVDIRDISWAIGRQDSTNNNFEYNALGKVIRSPGN
jgi:hypothetical protein